MKYFKINLDIHNLPLILLIVKVISFIFCVQKSSGFFESLITVDLLPEKFISYVSSVVLLPPIFPSTIISFLFAFFVFQILYFCSKNLESVWGSKVFTMYIFLNILIYSLGLYFLDISLMPRIDFLALTIFLAFAFTFPNQEFLVFFFIPMKVKTLGFISLGFLLISFGANFILLLLGLSNFIIFLLRGKFPELYLYRNRKQKEFVNAATVIKNNFIHECYYCGITDKDDENMQFRIRSENNHEYCSNHINKKDC